MTDRRFFISLVAIFVACSITVLGFPWDTLRLSFRTLSVMRSSLPHHVPGIWPLLSQESKRLLCPSNEASLRTPPMETQPTSKYRLTRYLFLSCESSEVLANWLRFALSRGLTPDEADIIYFSQVLEAQGKAEEALTLRQFTPDSALWYVGQGRLKIELDHDEDAAKQYFQIAQDIDPTLDARKSHMYMYLCMEAIRTGESSIILDPCESFEAVEHSVTSESLLGQKELLHGETEKAIIHFLHALELDDSQPATYFWTAKALLENGDVARAWQILKAGSQLATKYAPLELELARLEIMKGCYRSAHSRLKTISTTEEPSIIHEVESLLDATSSRENTEVDCE